MGDLIDLNDIMAGIPEGMLDSVNALRESCTETHGFEPILLRMDLPDGTCCMIGLCLRRQFLAEDERIAGEYVRQAASGSSGGVAKMMDGLAAIEDAFAFAYIGDQGSLDLYHLMPRRENLDDTVRLKSELNRRMPINRNSGLKLVEATPPAAPPPPATLEEKPIGCPPCTVKGVGEWSIELGAEPVVFMWGAPESNSLDPVPDDAYTNRATAPSHDLLATYRDLVDRGIVQSEFSQELVERIERPITIKYDVLKTTSDFQGFIDCPFASAPIPIVLLREYVRCKLHPNWADNMLRLVGVRDPAMSRDLAKRVAEVKRLRAFIEGLTEDGCSYGDGCPVFGSNHYRCLACRAREVLESTD